MIGKRDREDRRPQSNGTKHWLLGGPRSLTVLASVVFLAAVAAGLGYGVGRARGEGDPERAAVPAPTAQQTMQALEAPGTVQLDEAPETSLQSAQSLPHRNLGREEALELTKGVFSPELEGTAGILGELAPQKFLSSYSAVIPGADLPEPPGVEIGGANNGAAQPAGPIVVESSLPLRTENDEGTEEVVNLALQHAEGELKPVNPLTEVGVPSQLGEGISLPDAGVQIEVVDAPEDRAPSNVDQEYAFYPNVAENTDLVVAPTPLGVETTTTIRSAEAPQTTTYRLSLPSGAELDSGPSDAAEVVQGGKTTVAIPPATAIDAAGNPVPVETVVDGDELSVTVAPQGNPAYPILVDPTFIVESWHWTLQHDPLSAWAPSTNNASYQPVPYELWNPNWYPGPDLSSGFPGSGTWGTHADWTYLVPRYAEDQAEQKTPSSWVYQMYAEGVLFLPYGNLENYPALVLGLTDPNYGWAVDGVHYGDQGEMDNWNNSFTFTNEYGQTNVKGADMNLVTYEYEPQAKRRDTYMAYVAMAVVDEDAPAILELNPPEKWVGGSWASVPYKFEDAGLGMELTRIGLPGEAPLRWAEGFGCNGTNAAPCPRKVESSEAGRPALAYVPSELPTGKDKLEVTASDVLGALGTPGHSAQGFVVVKVDHTAPEISLSGPLTEQGTLGTHQPSYALRVNAKDGSEGAPQSGIAKVEVKVDGKKVTMPDEGEWAPNCQTQNCAFAGEWALNAAEFSAGAHEVEVVASDAVGNSSVKKLQIELRQPAPSLAVSGTITEQASLGSSLPRYKLRLSAGALAESPIPASPPTYSSAFGSAGAGNGQFSHPADIAQDPQGGLWVLDAGNNRVEKFNAAGEYLSQFGSTGSGNGQFNRPTAIAIDAGGNLWVVDAGNKRVQEFNSAGVYLGQFGSAGTGNGQFAGSGPEGIAIDYHGNIWVSDTYGGRLEEFTATGEFKRSVATRGLGSGQLLEPTAVDIGPGGNVWVADWGKNKVVEFSGTGQLIREFGSEGSGNGEFRHPDGIAVDGKGDVWVGDQNNERVQEFNQAGEYIGKFGASGSGPGQFNLGYPIGIATDSSGDLWVTDTGNNRVQKWISVGYATAGRPTYTSSFGSAGSTAGHFSNVLGLAVDANGNVWTADANNNLLQKFNSKGGFLAAYGGAGSGNGQLSAPTALTVNAGHIWSAELGNARLQEFSESGSYLAKFGQGGSAAGQLEFPWGVAFDNNHHIWVTETGPNSVQEFSESGALIKTLGTKGSGGGQFNGATGIAFGPGGKLWVVDIGNNRVEEFTESGSFLRQFGGSESEVGHLISPMGIYVDPSERVWVVDRGHNRVVEFNGSGEYITQFGAAGSGPGQFSTPQYITGDQAGHLFVSDGGNNRVEEWSTPARHSQVSTEITIDGKRVDAAEAACEAETCSTEREWTLESSGLSPGSHVVAIKATDGFGNTTTKTLTIQIQRDETKPTLEVGGELANAPEGWVQQESYGFHAKATDAGGYGVSSLLFRIDGASVASASQGCLEGGCGASIEKAIGMSAYSGGAHEAEVVATDGAGNKSVKAWTINVDPEGHISTAEAEATLEAVDATGSVNTVGTSEEEGGIEGTAPGLGIEQVGGEIVSTGSNVPMTVGAEANQGAELQIANELSLVTICPEPGEMAAGEAEEAEAGSCMPRAAFDERAKQEEEEVAAGIKKPGSEALTITPLGSATASVTVVDDNAAVAANSSSQVDTVTRPLSDGGLSFDNIRDSSAPEHYAYEMNLSPELEMRLVDPQHVEVDYKDGGFAAYTVTAVPAHDAVGTTVPTHLSVSGGNLLTLTVEHRGPSSAGGSFVYPVVAGTGWEGGFRTISVDLTEPPPPVEEEEEEEVFEVLRSRAYGPPILDSYDEGAPVRQRAYNFGECAWTPDGTKWPEGKPPAPLPPKDRQLLYNECHGVTAGYFTVKWATSMSGRYLYKNHAWAWTPADEAKWGPVCRHWGERQPALVECFALGHAKTSPHVEVYGRYKFPAGSYASKPECYELEGVLPDWHREGNPGETRLQSQYHLSRHGIFNDYPHCEWGHLERVF